MTLLIKVSTLSPILMAWATPGMMAVFLKNIPRMSVSRAKSLVFAFKESKLSDTVNISNTHVLEMFNITEDVA